MMVTTWRTFQDILTEGTVFIYANVLLIANTLKTKVGKIEYLHSNVSYYSVKHKFYHKAELQDIFNQEESSKGDTDDDKTNVPKW